MCICLAVTYFLLKKYNRILFSKNRKAMRKPFLNPYFPARLCTTPQMSETKF